MPQAAASAPAAISDDDANAAATLFWRSVQYFAACSIYMGAGPLLILLNNRILHEHNFPYPIFLTAFGVAFAALISRAALGLGLVQFTQPALLKSQSFYFCSSWPIGVLSALTLGLGNASYVYLSVATCQMLKAFTPAITLLMLFALRIESPSLMEILCVIIITIGTAGTTRGEIALPPIGLALQLGANFAEAVRIVLSQQLLSDKRLPLLEMQYHVSPPQLVALLAAAAVFELRTPDDRQAALASLAANPLLFTLAGFLGFGLQIAGLLAVKIAGSVAVKLLGIARGAALVLFESIVRTDAHSRPSAVQACGYATSLGGFLLYTWLRLRTTPASPPKTKQA